MKKSFSHCACIYSGESSACKLDSAAREPAAVICPSFSASIRLLFYECFHMSVSVLHQRNESDRLLCCCVLLFCMYGP